MEGQKLRSLWGKTDTKLRHFWGKNYALRGAKLRVTWGKNGQNYALRGAKLRVTWGKNTTTSTGIQALAFPIAIYSSYSYLYSWV